MQFLNNDLVFSPLQYKFLHLPGDAFGVKQLHSRANAYEPIISHANQKPILVTGVGGFIACHILEVLFSRGYSARGTVRSKNPDRIRHITDIYNKWKQEKPEIQLELFEADLLSEGSFDDAINGCDYVLHVASPFVLDVQDKQRDLIEPAKSGTLNVLRSCAKLGVKKVVVTSSIASITAAGVLSSTTPMKLFNENDWNEESSIDHNPYYFSKKLAEEAAWNFMKELKESDPRNTMQLVVINPTLVWGPSHTKTVNQSVSVMSEICHGNFPFIFNFSWCSVDVRDVAEAHVRAIENPNINGRYLCGNETVSMNYICEVIRKHFPEQRNVPNFSLTGKVGDLLVVADSLRRPSGLGTYLRSNIGKIVFVDNSKIVNDMGMSFRNMEQTIVDTVQNLSNLGLIPNNTPSSSQPPPLASKL